jgi:hypothetical protein
MVSPVVRRAVQIGHPDHESLDRNGLSRYGAYLFVQWGVFDECNQCLAARLLPPRPVVP